MTIKPFFYLKLFVDAKSPSKSGGSQTPIPGPRFTGAFCGLSANERVVHMV